MSFVIIVPTFNEAENVYQLLGRIKPYLGDSDGVLFVDDGNDNLPFLVKEYQDQGYPVYCHSRRFPTGGLAGAVLEGIAITTESQIVIMDGDLQHPPEIVPQLLSKLSEFDLVVASRYAGGSAGGLDGWVRVLVSSWSTKLTKWLLPRVTTTDPMSGFFAFNRSAVNVKDVKGQGFKILLEILARNNLKVSEVSFTFAQRNAGTSKANLSQGISLAKQLVKLKLASIV